MPESDTIVSSCILRWWDDDAAVHYTVDWNTTVCGKEIRNDTDPSDKVGTCRLCTNPARLAIAINIHKMAVRMFNMGDPMLRTNVAMRKENRA